MAVKIRLQRMGRKKRPIFHIIVADSRSPRDGRFIEKIGLYNPMTVPATIELDTEKAFEWLQKGAQPTDTARNILRFKGVLYRKHLQRGVRKGALTQEEADLKYATWIQEKEAKIAARIKSSEEEKEALRKKVSGERKPYVPKELEAETEEAAPDTESASATEENGASEASTEPTDSPEQPATEATAETAAKSPASDTEDSGTEEKAPEASAEETPDADSTGTEEAEKSSGKEDA